MKKHLLYLLFSILSLSAFGQAGSLSQSVYRSRVLDSTSVTTPSGWGLLYFNTQRSPAAWVFSNDNGATWHELGSGSGGGGSGTVTSVSGTTNKIDVVDGTTTPVIDISDSYVGQSSITTTGTLTSGSTGTGYTLSFTNSTLSGRVSAANIPLEYIIDQASASTAGATITLDCNSQIQRMFIGSATFSTAKDIVLSNTTNTKIFNFIFEVTNVAAVLTVPSDWLMATSNFDSTNWTPPATGKYELGGSFNDTTDVWYVKIAGPFN